MADFTEDWCAEGVSLRRAEAQLTAAMWDEMRGEYEGAKPFDRRAAYHLLLLTGLLPRWYDRPPRQGAIDILLEGPAGEREVVEVTSSLDGRYQERRQHTENLATSVSALYSGTQSWHLSFAEGWWEDVVATPRERRQLHERIVAELVDLDARQATTAVFRAAHWVRAVVVQSGEPGVHATGWSAGVRPSSEPYLDRLTHYLSSSSLIESKMSKLLDHANLLGASRAHLYLLMGSTGDAGNLLPWSPSLMTQGSFTAPEGLTDLWLDGGTGEVYHWTAEDGWRFHEAR